MRRVQALVVAAMLVSLAARTASAQPTAVIGSGRIGSRVVPGETIPSPSDFGFYADGQGGTFVCSMAGPGTGGWAGTEVMLVQGIVVPGTLKISDQTATFRCRGTLMMVPGPDGAPLKLPPASPPPAAIIRNAPFSVEVKTGPAGVGWLILRTHLRDFLGGNTGGILDAGEIRFR
jgi:hypothetical protein